MENGSFSLFSLLLLSQLLQLVLQPYEFVLQSRVCSVKFLQLSGQQRDLGGTVF